jgi:beta-RFAP synthase
VNGSCPRAASVTITASARLHLGFLDLNGGLGRRFGGIGLSIGHPATRLTISRARHPRIGGPERERVQRHVEAMRDILGLNQAYEVNIEEAIPAHVGLGSGTQLALAVATGMRRLHALPLDARGDAVRLGRGGRSGIGVGLFEHGGLMVDGGHGAQPGTAPIISRLSFPEPWRVVLVLDPACQGLHGKHEYEAFAALPSFSARSAADICRLVLMQALPALLERDLERFGAAITAIQRLLGDYFAPMQGGRRFTSAAVESCLDALERAGAHGVGQSSWGPTGFAFASSPEEAERLARLARRHPASRGLDIRVCAALNHGADITAGAPANMLRHSTAGR